MVEYLVCVLDENMPGEAMTSMALKKGHSKSTFAQDARIWTPPPPLFDLVRFRAPTLPSLPHHPQSTFILVRTPPLLLNFYSCEI